MWARTSAETVWIRFFVALQPQYVVVEVIKNMKQRDIFFDNPPLKANGKSP
jgi:hypothetical protein